MDMNVQSDVIEFVAIDKPPGYNVEGKYRCQKYLLLLPREYRHHGASRDPFGTFV